jgi:hypothetical protein
MIIKRKDPHLYFLCSVYVGLKRDARKSLLYHYLSVTFIIVWMLLYHCGPWSLLLSLPDMSLFKISIHYVDNYIDTGYYSA